MVIKQIAKQIKRTGLATLYYDESRDVQWISNGYAVWALYGMPLMEAENVLTALDITEKEKDKIVVRELGELPAGLDFSDADDSEEDLADPVISICYGGSLVIPLQTKEDGLVLADPELFKPLKDVEHMTVHARKKANGELYLACKGGLLLHGLVLPKELRSFAALPDILNKVSEQLEKSVVSEAQRRSGEDENQMEIDPETGEVKE